MPAGTPCPITGVIGQPVETITLKALLCPPALATLDPQARYEFCPDPTCETVYFSGVQTFDRQDVAVPVLAKDPSADVPVCYCFGWTRERLQTVGRAALEEIRTHVVAGRCGCEVNNPKGTCCLGDVSRVLSASPRQQQDDTQAASQDQRYGPPAPPTCSG